jgi:plastocyanin
MRLRRIATGALALTALIGGLSACGGDDSSSTSSGPVALTVKATSSGGKFAFDVPKEIEGGVVALTLDNLDSQPHELGMVRVKAGTTEKDVTDKLLGSADGAPIPDFTLDAGGVGFAAPKAKVTATQDLTPGTYVYFCTFGDGDAVHYKNGMLGTVTVKGDTGTGDLPASVETIAAKEYGFDVTSLTAGTHKLLFKNDGPKQLHHAQMFPLTAGSTIEQATAFLTSDAPPSADAPPPIDFDHAVGTTVLAPGQQQVVDMTLVKGQYIVLCFLNDRAGGPPHFTKGMLQGVTVG